MNQQNQFRQGDLLIERVAEVPQDGLKDVAVDGGRHILAYGEITGHHHSVATESGSFLREADDGTLYLGVPKDTALTHQEHTSVPLKEGTYKVTKQREYHRGEVRNVLD